ncbi:Sec-independent protein translocase subunit TatA [Kribbia dieselivorans]|uniref:Sec-independent protein translocase subunit TatA n=1 Tax=Kribbia dieselivorans TaxID=331526 RepID=UPI0008396530|nr:Sec-independent protein translocase subunit TatA [Kribbia dieselivorans]
MPNLGAPEIIVIALVILLLFGFKKLPDAARSIGRSARVFKSEMNEMKNEDEERNRKSDDGTTTRAVEGGSTTDSPIRENNPRPDNQTGPAA